MFASINQIKNPTMGSQFSVPNFKPPGAWKEVQNPSFFDHYKTVEGTRHIRQNIKNLGLVFSEFREVSYLVYIRCIRIYVLTV